jgi:hypothetical protein
MITSFAELQSLAENAQHYRALRQEHPLIPARQVLAYLKQGEGGGIQQFLCSHEWAYTGTAYGGDDERWSGEGRCYCLHCGADGDA